KILAFTLILVFAVSGATGLKVDINIEEITDHGAYEFQYRDSVESFQEMNVTVENLGSIGCTYKMRAVLDGENLSEIEHSRGYELWPGDTALMKIRHMPLNYTGEIQSDVYLSYCGQEELIGEANYTVEERQVSNSTVETETVSVDSSGAEVRTAELQNGYMIPEEAPAGWEVASSTVEDGKTRVSYDAPIFDNRRDITYSVVSSDGELVGTAEVNLNPEKSLLEMVEQNIWKILLVMSLLLNLGLVYNQKVKPLSEK
ncbi:MAG: hypothetical protein ACI9LV_000462, partial [Candidatus Nanohaloarchaea archaeon]